MHITTMVMSAARARGRGRCEVNDKDRRDKSNDNDGLFGVWRFSEHAQLREERVES